MNEDIIKSIVDYLISLLPENWTNVILRDISAPGYYNIYFYVKVNGTYIQCFNLPKKYSITMDELNSAFSKINKLCQQNQTTKKWRSYTLTLSSIGDFCIDYEYEEPMEKNKWKAKYGIQ